MTTTNNASPADLAAEIRRLAECCFAAGGMSAGTTAAFEDHKAKAREALHTTIACLQTLAEAGQGEPVEVAREARAEWFAVAMNAAACLEDAAACLRDKDAKRAAEGAAKHVREKCNTLWFAQEETRPAAAVEKPADDEPSEAEIGASLYRGNTVSFMYDKARAYGDAMTNAWEVLKEFGHPCDGQTRLQDKLREILNASLASKPGARRVMREAVGLTDSRCELLVEQMQMKAETDASRGIQQPVSYYVRSALGYARAAAPEAPEVRKPLTPDQIEMLRIRTCGGPSNGVGDFAAGFRAAEKRHGTNTTEGK